MAKTTLIEWADHTLNFWRGCTKVSPGCDLCYAEKFENRFGVVRFGNHARVRTSASTWAKAKTWDRDAARAGARPPAAHSGPKRRSDRTASFR